MGLEKVVFGIHIYILVVSYSKDVNITVKVKNTITNHTKG